MGLLDGMFGSNFDDPKTQFNMMLAAGLLGGTGKNLAGILGGALPPAMQARNQAQSAAGQRKQAEMQRKFMDMQMNRMQAQIEEDETQTAQRKAAAARQGEFDQALRGAVIPAQDFGAGLPQLDDTGDVMPSAQVGPRINQNAFLSAMARYSPKDFIDHLEKQKPPKPVANNFLETLFAAGIQPGSPAWNKAMEDRIIKETTHAPVFGTTTYVPPGQKDPVVAPFSGRTGQVGAPFGGKPPAGTGTKLKPIPTNINTAISANALSIDKIDKAMSLASSRPESFGMKFYLPEDINQRTDPEGVKARAAVSDIGSLKIHERSGAAVTASEHPRLKPFIPLKTDSPDTVKKKLERLREEYEFLMNEFRDTYTEEQGYIPHPKFRGRSGATESFDSAPKSGSMSVEDRLKKYQ